MCSDTQKSVRTRTYLHGMCPMGKHESNVHQHPRISTESWNRALFILFGIDARHVNMMLVARTHQTSFKHCLYKRSIHPTAGSSWKDKIVCGMKGQGGLKTCEQGAAACEMARHWALAHEITGYVKWSNAQGTPGPSLFPRFRVSGLVQVRSAWCCVHCSLIHQPLT